MIKKQKIKYVHMKLTEKEHEEIKIASAITRQSIQKFCETASIGRTKNILTKKEEELI